MAVSLKKIFEIVQENTLKCSKLIHFWQQKVEFKPECLAWSCHYATRCFVAFLGDISTLKSGWNMKKIFCCPALELFHCLPPLFCCLPLWKTVRLHGKKLQNATNRSHDTSGWLVFLRFLEELKTQKRPFKINWPLMISKISKAFLDH